MSSESLLSQHEEQSVGLVSGMEARAEHQRSRHYQSLYSFTTALGVGLVALVLFWILHYRDGFAWQSTPNIEFNWHPFLMVLGMVFIYSQSILVYRTLRYGPKKRLKIIHASMHCVAFILSVIGLKAVFDSHNLAPDPIPNLYSLHSWIGLITVIIFTAQFVFGFVSFLYPGLSKSVRQASLPIHVAIGIGTFVLAIVATMTGIMEKISFTLKDYSQLPSEGFVFNFIGLFVVLYGVMVLYMVNESDYKRTALPEDEIALTASD